MAPAPLTSRQARADISIHGSDSSHVELAGLTAGQRTGGSVLAGAGRGTFHTEGGTGGGLLAGGPATPLEFDASNSTTLRLPVATFTSCKNGAYPPAKLRCSRIAGYSSPRYVLIKGQTILQY